MKAEERNAENPSSLAEVLAARNRQMATRTDGRTPAERLEAMQRLIDESWAMLAANPEGMAHFMRRNFKARSVKIPARGESHGA